MLTMNDLKIKILYLFTKQKKNPNEFSCNAFLSRLANTQSDTRISAHFIDRPRWNIFEIHFYLLLYQ